MRCATGSLHPSDDSRRAAAVSRDGGLPQLTQQFIARMPAVCPGAMARTHGPETRVCVETDQVSFQAASLLLLWRVWSSMPMSHSCTARQSAEVGIQKWGGR